MKPGHDVLLRFARDQRGAIAVIFGLSILVMAMLVGFAIDSARVYNTSSRVQVALDAAALAGAKLMDVEGTTTYQVQQETERYFRAQFAELSLTDLAVESFAATPDWSNASVSVTAEVAIPSIFGTLANERETLTFRPQSSASYQAQKIELALVLDITGSMCDVPPALPSDACVSSAKLDALKDAANEIIDTFVATSPAAGRFKISIVPYAAAVNLGSRALGLTSGASSDGCVVERIGGQAFSDTAPSGGFQTTTTASFPAYSCPTAEVLPLTDISTAAGVATLKNRISQLLGFGGTAGHLGLAWGWYTISPSWSGYWPGSSAPRPFDKKNHVKAVVLMTDGEFNAAYNNGGELVPWPDVASADRTVTGTSANQALELCQAMQAPAKGIEIYTVGFMAPAAAETLLQDCSGPDRYYPADSRAALIAAFKAIAERFTAPRITS